MATLKDSHVRVLKAALDAYEASVNRFISSPKYNAVVKKFYEDELVGIRQVRADLEK